MAAQQPLPPIMKEELFPHGFPLEIGNNNARVELNKIKCSEPSCQIAIEVLKQHDYRSMLEKFVTIPEFYIHQMWHTLKLGVNKDSFTCNLDRKEVTVTFDYLHKVLLLPEVPCPDNVFMTHLLKKLFLILF